MNNFWNELILLEKVFFLCAITGGFAFLISASYQMFAGGGEADFDTPDDGGISPNETPLSTDVSFKLLSFFGVSSVLTLFGLAGLAASKASHLSPIFSIGIGIIAGALNYQVMKFIFKSFSFLQSTGKSNNIKKINPNKQKQ